MMLWRKLIPVGRQGLPPIVTDDVILSDPKFRPEIVATVPPDVGNSDGVTPVIQGGE